MRRLIFILVICLLPQVSAGQQASPETSADDRDFLTALLEDNLSDSGRDVRITGFAGAFSSRATFDELSIADDDGVWLMIRNGAISWNRGALLSGRIEISEMTADEIDLTRQPAPGKATAEAKEFALPELPVSVAIAKISVGKVKLGEALFGAAAEVSLTGSMLLENGEGSAEISMDRVDGHQGRMAFTGAYVNATRKATIDLLVSEAKDGIAATLMGLPGIPSIELAINGTGIIDDFRADIALSTDGRNRLGGTVTLAGNGAGAGPGERHFTASLGGDITPLLLPAYRDFVGTDVSLELEGSRTADGGLDLARVVLGSKGLDISGRLVLSPEGLPLSAALTTRIGLPDSSETLLPIPGEKTFLRNGELTLRYDSRRGDAWRLAGQLGGFRRGGMRIENAAMDGTGYLTQPGRSVQDGASFGGTVTFFTDQIAIASLPIAQAIGPRLSGKASFVWQKGMPLRLTGFSVAGDGYGAAGSLDVHGPEAGVEISGNVTARVDDMRRFSGLADRPIGGSADLRLDGRLTLLTGAFDIAGDVTGKDLRVSQAELDRLLSGTAQVTGSVRRDVTGIEIRSLDASAKSLMAHVSGLVRTGASNLAATFRIGDLAELDSRYRGSVAADATLVEAGGARHLTLDASSRDISIGQEMADLVLAGASTAHLSVEEKDGRVRLKNFELNNPQIAADGRARTEGGDRQIDLSARLRDVALFAPGFSGPLTLAGIVSESAESYLVDLDGQGPGATSARIEGRLAADFSKTDIRIHGTAQSAFLNPFIAPRNISGPIRFDLSMIGPPRLASLSGRVSLENAQLVAPTFGINADDLRVTANLADESAQLSAETNVRGGGQIVLSGTAALTKPYQSDLTVDLRDVHLRDPEMYDTSDNGQVTVSGPVAGGASISGSVALGSTEIRIASTGLGGTSDLGKITHIGESAPVRQTLVRAGMIDQGDTSQSRGAPYRLDLAVSAPGRIFVRGRGLDAELGGALHLGGTSDDILPAGQFNLIRGRLDILGKRLTINEGLVQLQGALLPYIRFVASTETDGFTTTVLVEGNVAEPEIKFVSSPELPEEEVIAHLLFGRDLTSLSAFQALQLASAVATLAGRGGEGIVSRLRNSFGLDDLDVTSEQNGATAVKLGKYLSEKVYTDVTVGSDGKSEININLDIRPGLAARGTLQSDGATGLGVYYEKDY